MGKRGNEMGVSMIGNESVDEGRGREKMRRVEWMGYSMG